MRHLRPIYLIYLMPLLLGVFLLLNLQEIKQQGFVNYFNAFHPVFKHFALAAASVIIIYGLSKYAVTDGERRARKWIKVLTPGDNNPSLAGAPEIQPGGRALKLADPDDRIVSQLAEIRIRIAHHFDVMVYFYVRYYMAILTFGVAAAMAAVTLLFISKRGIDGANPYILNLFIVTTACSAFYGAFPGVFRQEQNITDNKALYLQYVALEQEVLSYSVTGEDITGTKTTAAKFIHYVDQQLAKFNNIAIGFDPSKVPNFKSVFDEHLNPAARSGTQTRGTSADDAGKGDKSADGGNATEENVTKRLVAKQQAGSNSKGSGGQQQQQQETARGGRASRGERE